MVLPLEMDEIEMTRSEVFDMGEDIEPPPLRSHSEEVLEVLLAMMSMERPISIDFDYAARAGLDGDFVTIGKPEGVASFTPTVVAPIDPTDRAKMLEWYHSISAFLSLSPATASRSLFLLDRFLHAPRSKAAHLCTVSREEFQLAALTTLFLAIKLYERLNVKIGHVSYLSRGRYGEEEVAEMERRVLDALEWKVLLGGGGAGSKLDFAELILDILLGKRRNEEGLGGGGGGGGGNNGNDPNKNRSVEDAIRELTDLQLQLSDFEFRFSTKRPSVVAFASVVNAIRMKHFKLPSVRDFDGDVGTVYSREILASKVRAVAEYFDRAELERTMHDLALLVDVDIDVDVDVDLVQDDDADGRCGCSHPDCARRCGIPPPPSPQSYFPLDEESPTSSAATLDRPVPRHEEPEELEENQNAFEAAFDMAQSFLCCGAPPYATDTAATTDHDRNHEDDHNQLVVTDENFRDCDCNYDNTFGPSQRASRIIGPQKQQQRQRQQQRRRKRNNSHSPTTIATILFGGHSTDTTDTVATTTTTSTQPTTTTPTPTTTNNNNNNHQQLPHRHMPMHHHSIHHRGQYSMAYTHSLMR